LHILDKLSILSEMYYARNNGDTRWQDMKLQAYMVSQKVTALAMEQRYAHVYVQAMAEREKNRKQAEQPCQTVALTQQAAPTLEWNRSSKTA